MSAFNFRIGHGFDAHRIEAGEGSEADQNAVRWYQRAYRKGSAEAAFNLAIHFRARGEGGRSVLWMRKAAELGDEDARGELALER